jgi:hypothetical protein
MTRLSDPARLHHLEHMPLGLVGQEWEPGGAEFEAARVSTARALTRLAKVDWPADQVMDWEVRSWLREQHYGDPGMGGLRRAAASEAAGLMERGGDSAA